MTKPFDDLDYFDQEALIKGVYALLHEHYWDCEKDRCKVCQAYNGFPDPTHKR